MPNFWLGMILIICSLFPSFIAPYSYDKQVLSERFIAPCASHLFGTDDFGRDIFSRVVYGARISLTIGVASVSFSCVIGVVLGAISGYARIVRASVLSEKEKEYVEAARSIGAGDFDIIVKHILPNCLAPIIVPATMSVATAILSVASLSFIGLGIEPPTPEWG